MNILSSLLEKKIFKEFHLFLFLNLLLIIKEPASAEIGSSAGITLFQPIGSRASSMGEAYATAEGDVFSVHYNPSSDLTHKQFSMLYQTGIADDSFGGLAIGLVFNSLRLSSTLVYYNAGEIELIDTNGNHTGVNAQTDYLFTLCLSKRLKNNVSLGGNLKFLNSTLVEKFSTTVFLFDMGVNYRVNKYIKIGVALQNLGNEVKYYNISEKLSWIFRIGISYSFSQSISPSSSFLAFDIVKISHENKFKYHTGFEYTFKRLISFRLGYKMSYTLESWSLGFGLRLENASIDYAFVPFVDLGNTHKIGFSVNF